MFKKTWRWFGQKDEISLAEIKQMGVEGIVTALHHIPNGEIWPESEIQNLKYQIESHGMEWAVVESLPVSEGIKTASTDRVRLLENYKTSLINLGKCGIQTVCYNFMPVLDWARTDTQYPLKDGGISMHFDYTTFAMFDIYILERPDAHFDYPEDTVRKALALFSETSEEACKTLAYNIIVLTQGFINGAIDENTKDYLSAFRNYLSAYDHIDSKQLKQNLKEFLVEIMPVADQYGIKMCIHPDDPPFSVLGLPRIVSNLEDLQWIIQQYPSINNGITFCSGSLSVLEENDLEHIAQTIGSHIHFVHLRATQRSGFKSFYEAEHLEGSLDMYAVVKALLQEQQKRRLNGRYDHQIPFRPDHGIKILDDVKRQSNPGYPLYGRLKGLAEIEGLAMAIERNLKEK